MYAVSARTALIKLQLARINLYTAVVFSRIARTRQATVLTQTHQATAHTRQALQL